MVAVHLLPQAIAGLLWNVVAGRIMHRINNTVIMIFGATCYLAANLLLSFIKIETSYWALMFPALILIVAGADLQFNVGNVSYTPVFYILTILTLPDVRDAVVA